MLWGIAVRDRDPRNPAHSRKRVEGCLNLYRPHHEPLMKAASSAAFGAARAILDVVTASPMGGYRTGRTRLNVLRSTETHW